MHISKIVLHVFKSYGTVCRVIVTFQLLYLKYSYQEQDRTHSHGKTSNLISVAKSVDPNLSISGHNQKAKDDHFEITRM